MTNDLMVRMKERWSDLTDFVSRAARGRWHLPPRALRQSDSRDFEAAGEEFLRHFIELAGLAPSHRVLEIGSGCGRTALPLTEYLRANGTYAGIDVRSAPVAWCQRHISRRHPDFRFYLANVSSARYNPSGTVPAADYTFPFDDGSFDVVCVTSVFTHLLPDGFERYVQEILRVLKKKGTLFTTFFLLNDAQRALAEQRLTRVDFPHARGVCHVSDAAIPDRAVAYDESYLRTYFTRFGLHIREPIPYGTWSGRDQGRSTRDIVVASRARPVLRSV